MPKATALIESPHKRSYGASYIRLSQGVFCLDQPFLVAVFARRRRRVRRKGGDT